MSAPIDHAMRVHYNLPLRDHGYNQVLQVLQVLVEGAVMSAKPTHEELLRDITERAKALWGEAKAAEMAAALERTATEMEEIDRAIPKRDMEPGYYQ